MQRVTLTGRESWANTNIDDLLSSLRREKRGIECLILARKGKAPSLERVLSVSDFDIQTRGNKYWVWYRVSQKKCNRFLGYESLEQFFQIADVGAEDRYLTVLKEEWRVPDSQMVRRILLDLR